MVEVREWMADLLMCAPESLPPENTPLSEIEGWDSLRHVSLIVRLEKQVNEKLTAEEIKGIVTLRDVASILRQKVIDA